MSNPFATSKLPYFQAPQSFITTGQFTKLKTVAFRLYAWLLFEAQRMSRPTITAGGKQLAEQLCTPESKVGAARKQLVDMNLVIVEKEGTSYRYTLCNPESGHPLEALGSGGRRFDFNTLTREQLSKYFEHHLDLVTHTPNGIDAACPFHDDTRPSLTVNLDSCVWQCHGCKKRGKLIHFEKYLAASKGVEINDGTAHKQVVGTLLRLGAIKDATEPPEAVYAYVGDFGEVEFEVLRFSGKRFQQRRPNPDSPGQYIYDLEGCRKLLYRLPEIEDAMTVIVVEGERDADTVHQLGIMDDHEYPVVGTTNSGGAGSWRDEYSEQLEGKRVILIGDNDDPGRKHMTKVENSLNNHGIENRRVILPNSVKDISAFMARHSLRDLWEFLPKEWLGDREEDIYDVL